MILMLAPSLGIAQPTPTPCPAPQQPFGPPGKATVGLAWDGSKFWAADRGAESWIYYCSDRSHSIWKKSFQWKDGRLGTIAWGDGGLWVVDEERGKVIFLDLAAPRPHLTKEVAIPPNALRQPPAITGIAWDGATLWLATGCGLCSSFYRIDPRTSAILKNFFPRCEPRGLTCGVRNKTRYLWTIAYNGPAQPPKVSQRQLTSDPLFVLKSHTILRFFSDCIVSSWPTNPTAIAFDGNFLWVVDQADPSKIYSFHAK